MTPKEMALALARALDSKKGQNIRVLQTDSLTTLADYFVLCTGTSAPQLKALAKEMLSLGTITKIDDIVDIANRNLDSNLDYGEMIWFGEQFLLSGDTQVRFHNLPGDYTGTLWSPTYQNYQSYVFVNSSALRELVNTYLNPYLEDITPDMQHVIHDTTVNNLPVESGGEETAGETASGGTTE